MYDFTIKLLLDKTLHQKRDHKKELRTEIDEERMLNACRQQLVKRENEIAREVVKEIATKKKLTVIKQ